MLAFSELATAALAERAGLAVDILRVDTLTDQLTTATAKRGGSSRWLALLGLAS